MSFHDRRDFIKTAGAGIGTLAFGGRSCAAAPATTTVVAAIQYAPVLGDVGKNLKIAEELVLDAINQDARWIVLPEFFTSGLAMHPSMFDAPREIDGTPAQLLKRIALQHQVYIGGSFLCRHGRDVFNTCVLATPSGKSMSHDKDFPSTGYESSFYAGGEDAKYAAVLRDEGCATLQQVIQTRPTNNARGVFSTADARVGVALCWELVRYRTTRRVLGRIDFLLGASGWWWSSPDLGWPGRDKEAIQKDRAEQIALIQAAPRNQARMLGVPVVHANFVGDNPGFLSSKFDTPATGRYLGQSQIVDHKGNAIRLLGEKEEGVAVEEVRIVDPKPNERIPSDDFWMDEVNSRGRRLWFDTGAEGRDYYLTETRRNLDVTEP